MQVILNIPDNKMAFFMELVKNLGFVKVGSKSSVLTDEQVQLVEEERKKIKEDPQYGMDWEDARKTLKLD